ncbi:DUF4870 domain-containing protein [Deinococcus sp.]|uniref:DUF4870 domain-containing protein n=1 Tax=Deinococcus sp. TaxID=47478 RepID=UPI002869CAD8|nr:DUF4870 domain-containing protein [Deinococcus sp.]
MSPLLGWGLPLLSHLFGPLVVWLLYRNRDPIFDRQGRAVLKAQMDLTLYAAALGIAVWWMSQRGTLDSAVPWLTDRLGQASGIPLASSVGAAVASLWIFFGVDAALFFFALAVAVLFNLVPLGVMAVALVRARRGQVYRDPFSIRFVR